jgi:hypothetical protein
VYSIPTADKSSDARKSPFSRAPCLVFLLIAAGAGIIYLIISLLSPTQFSLDDLTLSGFSFDQFQANNNHTILTSPDNRYWGIEYEKKVSTQFLGKVRHASNINSSDFPILTHDILVTTLDFADAEKVTTSVSNHHFLWLSQTSDQPVGTINLLHTIPKNDEIYQLISGIKSTDVVKISGWEIIRINAYSPEGKLVQWWQDTGCNTLLVDFVEVTSDK